MGQIGEKETKLLPYE